MTHLLRITSLICIVVVLGFAFSPIPSSAQDAFITTWETTSDNELITIPTDTSKSDYNFEIDWGDGTTETVTGTDPDPSHTYSSAGNYQIEITGTFPRIFLNDRLDEHPNSNKLISIDQWGDIQWESMASAFSGAENLSYSATDTPDLSSVTDISSMFRNTESFNGDISDWNVSNVKTFDYLFRGSLVFNKDIGGWDLSSAKSMDNMFSFANNFNGDIGSWDVSEVESMRETFLSASSFNKNIENWDVSNVEDMTRMFSIAESFNKDISGWDVSNVKNMSGMFDSNFNLNYSLGKWDVSNVEDMSSVLDFSGISPKDFDLTIQGWSQISLNDNVIFGAENVEYCDSGPFLNHLEEAFDWFIFDVSKSSDCSTDLVGDQTKLIQGDDIAHFDGTGASVEFLNSIGAWITAARYDDSPKDVDQGLPKPFRLVIAGSKFSELEAKLRVDVDEFGIESPGEILVFRRSQPGRGSFSELPTTFDQESGELVADIEAFGEFAFANEDDPLPIELASFEGITTENGVRLTWQTASETNNSGFDVQRRAEGSSWTKIDFVEGGGTTSKLQSYRFTDADLPYDATRLSYRLKQIDNDGTTTLSDPVVVERSVDTAELLGTFPNPASQQSTVRYALPDRQDVEIRLYDALGRQVRTVVNAQKEGRHEETIDVSGLSSGTYFLQLQAEGQTKTQQLTVTR